MYGFEHIGQQSSSRVTNWHHIEIRQNIVGFCWRLSKSLSKISGSVRLWLRAPVPLCRFMTSTNAHDLPETGASNVNGLRVLLVEDSWQVAAALKLSLEASGAEVVGPLATA